MPVMALCMCCGSADSVADEISGYTGEMNRPISGKMKPMAGTSSRL